MQVTKIKPRKICVIIFIFVCLFAMALSVDQADEWPSGGYGLPRPRSGCPGDKEDGWNEGWRFQDMEDAEKSNKSTVSSGIHMDVRLIGGRKDIYRKFCMKRNNGPQTRIWPNGSYCLYKERNEQCPIYMNPGWVKWDDEDYQNTNKAGGSLPDGTYDKDTVIRYCCQTAGNWHDSIELPASRPFYLLTSNSASKPECQMVKWALSYLEYIVFDTNDQDNTDEQSGQHVFLEGRKLYYCYYKDCRRKLTGPSGLFRSHPLPVDSMDPHSQYCSWLITVAETHVVSLKFKELTIPFCGDTFLKIYDGLNDTASLLRTYCGANATREVNISSTSNNVYVVSNSGSFGNGRNPKINFSFVAQYSAENKSRLQLTSVDTTRSSVSKRTTTFTVSTSPTILTSQNVPGSNSKERPTELNRTTTIIVATTVGAGMLLISDCRRKLTGPSGLFRSHPLPVDSMDPHSQYCSWLITVAETHVVSLKFKELTIPFCGDTFLKIYDGLNDTASLLRTYCGANATREVNISSTSNNVYVVSNSGSFGNGRNPKINFSFVAQYSAENKSRLQLTSVDTTRSSVSKRTTTFTVSTSPTILTSQNVPGSNSKERPTELNRTTTIIVATTVGAGMLLIIVLIVLLVKLRRRKQPLKLSTLVDVPLGAVKASPEMLATDQEPNVGTYDDVVTTNTSNDENAPVRGQEPLVAPPIEHEYQEPERSPQHPIYTALDNAKRKNSDEDNYQKLLKRNSDYAVPAHERQEPAYEDVKPGSNLPGYAELDQMKRETEESQYPAYQKLV